MKISEMVAYLNYLYSIYGDVKVYNYYSYSGMLSEMKESDFELSDNEGVQLIQINPWK